MRWPRFESEVFRYGLEAVLDGAHRGAADVDEVKATAARIEDGDADSWVLEWVASAGAVRAAGNAALAAGQRDSALARLRRAASYYGAALALLARSAEEPRRPELWRRERECWERIVDLVGGERLAVACLGTTLPAYFFAAGGGRRPLVIMNNGSAGAGARTWALGGAAAAERGYHWMTFDGPGQGAALMDQRLAARPDWEAVLTPVLDAGALARPGVDPARVAVIAVDEGGFSVCRALGFEHRPAAAVADQGVVDLAADWTAALPGELRGLLRRGDREAFERELRLALLFDPEQAAVLRERAAPFGGLAALYDSVSAYRLDGDVARVCTPLLVTQPAGERRWPGQPALLFERLRGPRALARTRPPRRARRRSWTGSGRGWIRPESPLRARAGPARRASASPGRRASRPCARRARAGRRSPRCSSRVRPAPPPAPPAGSGRWPPNRARRSPGTPRPGPARRARAPAPRRGGRSPRGPGARTPRRRARRPPCRRPARRCRRARPATAVSAAGSRAASAAACAAYAATSRASQRCASAASSAAGPAGGAPARSAS
jgi:hypothetical protein